MDVDGAVFFFLDKEIKFLKISLEYEEIFLSI